jgi:hypothetical protein
LVHERGKIGGEDRITILTIFYIRRGPSQQPLACICEKVMVSYFHEEQKCKFNLIDIFSDNFFTDSL